MKTRILQRACCRVLLLLLLLCPAGVEAAEGVARISTVYGPVDILDKGKIPSLPARVGARLHNGDMVRTKSGGYAEVLYDDGVLLKIAQRSRVDIGGQLSSGKGAVAIGRLARGKVEAIVDPAAVAGGNGAAGKSGRFEIHTPNAVAGVRGTDFIVTYQRQVTGILVRRGNVYTYNQRMPERVVNLAPATVTSITAGSPPLPARAASLREIERLERGISPQPESRPEGAAGEGAERPPGSSDQGGGAAVAGDIIPAGSALPPLVAAGDADGGLSQPLAPAVAEALPDGSQTQGGSAGSPESITAPPPPPLFGSTNVNVDIGFITGSPPPTLPTATNVTVGVVFPALPPPPPIPASTNVNVDIKF